MCATFNNLRSQAGERLGSVEEGVMNKLDGTFWWGFLAGACITLACVLVAGGCAW